MDHEEEISVFKLGQGDEEELKIFYEKHFALFVAFARNIVPSEDECKDIVHDIFIKYWKTKETFHELVAIKAFFYKAIRNQCLNHLRHTRAQNRFFSLNQMESVEFLYETVIKEETIRIIYEEISKLSEMEQKVLLLSLDGKNNEEIATELNIAISTVKTHKARSYSLLRKRLNLLKLVLILLG